MKLTTEGKIMVAGHRGELYNRCENTMAAFREAIECGCDMIETDVQLTKDGYVVLMHDHSVERTTNGRGLVKDLTFEELRSLTVGGEENEKVPTLEELLQLMADMGVTLNLEIKEYFSPENKERCDACIEKCVALVEKYGFGERMVFNSFDAYVLEYLAEKYPKYLLHGFYPYSYMKNVRRNPDEYLFCACLFDDWVKEYYDHLLSKGIEPWVGTGATQKWHIKQCFDYGAKLITANFPAETLEKLRSMGLHE